MNVRMRQGFLPVIHFIFYVAAFAAVVFIPYPNSEARKPVQKMKVNQPLAGRLMSVLVETEALHRAMIGPEDEKVAKGKGKGKKEKPRAPASIGVNDQIKTLISSLNKASEHSKLAGPSRVALEKIIGAAKSRLQDAQSVSKNSKRRTEFISESVRQIIQIAQMYDLNHQYKIFFCSKDRSMWIQSGKKAQNPFDGSGKFKGCGIVMP
jgi:hypothetical protein